LKEGEKGKQLLGLLRFPHERQLRRIKYNVVIGGDTLSLNEQLKQTHELSLKHRLLL
jgi:hypothetical protein